jgi:hypothetical protein
MNEDRVTKLFAGHIGVCAVLVNILIDKGIITREEAADRFWQAHAAATHCSGGKDVAQALAAMFGYVAEERSEQRGKH